MQYRKIQPKTFSFLGKKITIGEGEVYLPDNFDKPLYVFSGIVKDKKLKRTLKINKNIFI